MSRCRESGPVFLPRVVPSAHQHLPDSRSAVFYSSDLGLSSLIPYHPPSLLLWVTSLLTFCGTVICRIFGNVENLDKI